MSGASTGNAVKAKLSALAARQSHGATSDPSSLTATSSKNAKLPAADAAPTKTTRGKGKGKDLSARKKKKVEKMKEKAVGLNAVLENKVRQKEGRKAQRDRAKRAWD